MKKKLLAVALAGAMMATLLSACNKTVSVESSELVDQIASEIIEEGSEIVADFEEKVEEMTTDISGCDTFTQIVDKLPAGQGYANVNISGEDVLLVTGGTYDSGEGAQNAIDAEIFRYNEDGIPEFAGSVHAGGTAYPLAIKDGVLYGCANHYVTKYALKEGKVAIMEQVTENFDEEGISTFVYSSDDGGDYSEMTPDEVEKIYKSIFDEYDSAEAIEFTVVE